MKRHDEICSRTRQPRRAPVGRGVGAFILVAAALSWGCEDPPPPPPQEPTFEENSLTLTCEPSMDAAADVLAGGTVQVLDDNIAQVDLSIGGLRDVISLQTEPLAEDVDASTTPQTWQFTFDATRRVLCTSDLVLTFIAVDEDEHTATINARAAAP